MIFPADVGNEQLDHRVATEDRLGGWEIELGQAKVGTPGVQAHKEIVAVEAEPVALLVYEVILGRRNAPRGALFRGQSTPAGGDRADVAAVGLLFAVRGLRGGTYWRATLP